jgi:hypothetical protein
MELRLFPDGSEEFSPEKRRASPTRVLTASLSEKIGVAFGLLVSCYACFSLLAFPIRPPSIWVGLRIVSAFFCSGAVLIFCWSAIFAYFIRKCNLPPKWCRWAGTPFLLIGLLFLAANWFSMGSHGGLPSLLGGIAVLTSNACQKLAYPAVESKQPFD